jgi:hypothetical protein
LQHSAGKLQDRVLVICSATQRIESDLSNKLRLCARCPAKRQQNWTWQSGQTCGATISAPADARLKRRNQWNQAVRACINVSRCSVPTCTRAFALLLHIVITGWAFLSKPSKAFQSRLRRFAPRPDPQRISGGVCLCAVRLLHGERRVIMEREDGVCIMALGRRPVVHHGLGMLGCAS